MLENELGHKIDPVQQAISKLRTYGYDVERAEFPPLPLPGLYTVSKSGVMTAELTERQIVRYAAEQ